MTWLGDFSTGSTVHFKFTTVNSTGAPAAFSSGGVTVYKDASTAPSATGLTLTSTFAAITGLNHVQVDMAGTSPFYTPGSKFIALVSSGAASESLAGYVLATWSVGHKPEVTVSTAVTISTATAIDSVTNVNSTVDADVRHWIGVAPSTLGPNSNIQISTASLISTGQSIAVAALVDTVTTVSTAATFLDAMADVVWDEVLTDATHNIATSAGRRLRTLQDFGVYEGGAVWIDTVNGTPGTTDFENGTVTNPVDSIADARTIADSVGLKIFHILPGSSITLAQAFDDFEFTGFDYTLALGGQSVARSLVQNATVSGTFTGNPNFEKCDVGNITGPGSNMDWCALTGTVTNNGTNDWRLEHCYSAVAGTGTPTFDFGAAALNSAVNFRLYSGGIEVQNIGTAGTDNMSLEGFGQLVLNANCSSGTIAIRGMFTVTDNSGGAVTLSDDARIAVDQVSTFKSSTDQVLANVTQWLGVAPSTLGPNANLQVSTGTLVSTAAVIALAAQNSTLSSSDVNAEVVDALATDTYEEPGFGTPSTAQTIAGMHRYLYSALRNQITVSSSAKNFYGDAGAVLWGKTLSQDSTGSTGVYLEAGASTST